MRLETLPARLLGLGLAAAAALAAAVAAPAVATAAPPPIIGANAPNKIQDSYVVVLKDNAMARSAVSGHADALAARYGGKVGFVYRAALKGFSVTMSAEQARKIAADPAVSYVEQDRTVSVLTDQPNPPSWGLDRVDQADLPLNQNYSYSAEAANVTAYVIDTGINYDHTDFGGRATFGFDAFTDGRQGKDCHGHGTHVSGTVGGNTFGLAKKVKLKAVRVLNCQGGGSITTEAAGVDWVTANAVLPAVANMSLYTGVKNEPSRVLDDAVRASIGVGVSYVVAAGNFNDDSCAYSPQRVTETINVAATARTDARASFSSFGTCTDIFAPGQDIISASYSNNSGSATMSGTSMASPHVAGAVALYLSDNPAKTPAEVHSAILAQATPNKVTNPGAGTPNRLLRVNGTGIPGVSVTNPGAQTTAVGGTANLQLSASGGTTPYTWSATGLPPGLSIGASTGLISGTATTAGTYNVTATATATAGGAGSASFVWTVGTTPTCAPQTNATDVPIPDLSTVTSSVTFSGCTGNASATSTAEVHIKHTWRGDLVIDLVAPDGTAYRLKNSSSSDSADNVDQTYTTNLSTETRNGTWQLRVQDVARQDTGTIDTWTLTL
ncbi:subtilisin family serine protease [Kibdelosporangium banguiense]|uniref:Subtilisin family serine protease n=1 Tax=Kibdelosporangium banguiense TaxID=1365924 RepID=A0ABS4TQS3_9PSEU|nr:S8 family serine peptidase [Kibdelosporangium banguiense]MBP2326767.1 subtilisin family serine protease [Kibdelosporangium banguiense]